MRRSNPEFVDAALFRANESQLVNDIIAMAVGAASLTAASAVTGNAVDQMLKTFSPATYEQHVWPHRVLIVVETRSVLVYASNRHGVKGGLLARFDKGDFRSTFHRYPGEVDLKLECEGDLPFWVRGRWGVLHHSCLKVAEAATRLAQPVNPA